MVSWEIIECPEVLLVKLAGRDTIRNRKIKLARNFVFKGFVYELQSGMLYTGTGETGHWRSVSNIDGEFIVYDDERAPYMCDYSELCCQGTDLSLLGKVFMTNLKIYRGAHF